MRAFEMRCYRAILNIKWFRRVTNAEVQQRIQTDQDIVSAIKKRKLGLFGHICRMTDGRLVKNIMVGIVEGGNRRGRPRRSWIDDIKEWTKLTFPELYRLAQSRRAWRAVVRSS